MQHEIVSAQGQPPLQFASKCCNRFLQEWRPHSCQVDQIIGMNYQRLKVILLAQSAYYLALAAAQRIGLPLPRTGREYLKGIPAKPVCAFGSLLHAARNGGMDANATGSCKRRLLWL